MELKAELLKEHSRKQTECIAVWIGQDPGRFGQLMSLFLNDTYRVVQRASAVVSMVGCAYPALLHVYLPAMVDRLSEEGTPVALKRNVVKLLQYAALPEELHAAVINVCFDFLNDPEEAVAVRCHAMSVLGHMAVRYPELKQELAVVIKEHLAYGSAGFKARARMLLSGIGG